MAGFLEGLKNLFKKPIVPALAIGALGFGLGALVGKKRAQNNSIFGFGFDSKGNYDGYIGSGRLRGLYHGPHGHHGHHHFHGPHRSHGMDHHGRFSPDRNYYREYSHRDHHRFNYCPMAQVQTRPYTMSHDWRNGPKEGGMSINTGDGNIYIGGDLSGKKVTIYG